MYHTNAHGLSEDIPVFTSGEPNPQANVRTVTESYCPALNPTVTTATAAVAATGTVQAKNPVSHTSDHSRMCVKFGSHPHVIISLQVCLYLNRSHRELVRPVCVGQTFIKASHTYLYILFTKRTDYKSGIFSITFYILYILNLCEKFFLLHI